MATLNDVDRQAQCIRLILFVLGAILTIVGWAKFAGAQPAAPPARQAIRSSRSRRSWTRYARTAWSL